MEKSADQQESGKMAPKNKAIDPINSADESVKEEDLQEMQAVSDSLDQLSTALDFFEQRTDNIIEQLKELLHSNREIRQQLALEKAASESNDANNAETME